VQATAATRTPPAPVSAKPREAKKRRKERFIDDYLPALLGQASSLISAEFHQVVGAHGFTVSEWRVLASLEGGDPVSIGRLASTSLNKQSTLTRLLDRMEERGQVERVPQEAGDRRITLVRITPLGSRTVSHLIDLARKHAEQVLEPFGKEPAEELKAMLRTIIDLHQQPEPGSGLRPRRAGRG
jgi:DNA-binding MarR family transcriptional regulator